MQLLCVRFRDDLVLIDDNSYRLCVCVCLSVCLLVSLYFLPSTTLISVIQSLSLIQEDKNMVNGVKEKVWREKVQTETG